MKLSKSRKRLHVGTLMVVFLLTVLFLANCATKSPGVTSAKIYLGLTPPDYNKAMEQLLVSLEKDPENAEAHFLLGKIYAEKKMYRKMHEEFQKAESPKLEQKYLAELRQMRRHKWTEVLNSGILLGKRQKQVDEYRLELLTDFSKYAQYKDSLKSISSGLERAEGFSWDSYQIFSQAESALEDLKRTLEKEAIERYYLAVLLDSTRYEAFLNLAAEYVHGKDLDTALGYYEKAYRLKPEDSKVMNDYAMTLLAANKYEKALGLYERILEKDPTNVNALVNLAMIYAREGETEKSQNTYSTIISIDPEYKDAYFNRGLVSLSEVQSKMSALRAYGDSVEKNPKDKQLWSRKQSVGEDFDRLFAKAEGDFRKTSEMDPGNKDGFFHLGLLYASRAQLRKEGEQRASDFSRAESLFAKSLELDPQDAESMKYLGFVLLSQKKWQEASLPLERLVQLDPTDREAWGYLAIAYANLGKRKQAEEAMKKAGR